MRKIVFSQVTRLSGLLSVDVFLEHDKIVDANACSTMFRGFEWAMRNRHVTDAVYMTQRVCGICSLAHGAVSSYLLDELYGINDDMAADIESVRRFFTSEERIKENFGDLCQRRHARSAAAQRACAG